MHSFLWLKAKISTDFRNKNKTCIPRSKQIHLTARRKNVITKIDLSQTKTKAEKLIIVLKNNHKKKNNKESRKEWLPERIERSSSLKISPTQLFLSLSLSLKWRLESGNNRGSLTVLFSQVWYLSFPFPLSLSSSSGVHQSSARKKLETPPLLYLTHSGVLFLFDF